MLSTEIGAGIKQNRGSPKVMIGYARVVVLKLFNMRGQELMTLMNERLEAGHHQVTFSADDLPSGMYIYRLMAGDFVASKKMLLLR